MKDATMRPMISARARNMEPRFGDQSWSQRREQRISAGQQARQEKQLAQCTFKPQINKASQTMDRRAQAISFRSGCRPASSSAKARRPSASTAESTGQADGAKGAPVSFEDFVKQRSEPETGPTPSGSRPQSLGALKAVPAPEAGIDFQTFLGNTGPQRPAKQRMEFPAPHHHRRLRHQCSAPSSMRRSSFDRHRLPSSRRQATPRLTETSGRPGIRRGHPHPEHDGPRREARRWACRLQCPNHSGAQVAHRRRRRQRHLHLVPSALP